MQSKALIVQNLAGQAFVRDIADDFLAGAVITLFILISLFFLRYHKKKKAGKIEATE